MDCGCAGSDTLLFLPTFASLLQGHIGICSSLAWFVVVAHGPSSESGTRSPSATFTQWMWILSEYPQLVLPVLLPIQTEREAPPRSRPQPQSRIFARTYLVMGAPRAQRFVIVRDDVTCAFWRPSWGGLLSGYPPSKLEALSRWVSCEFSPANLGPGAQHLGLSPCKTATLSERPLVHCTSPKFLAGTLFLIFHQIKFFSKLQAHPHARPMWRPQRCTPRK